MIKERKLKTYYADYTLSVPDLTENIQIDQVNCMGGEFSMVISIDDVELLIDSLKAISGDMKRLFRDGIPPSSIPGLTL